MTASITADSGVQESVFAFLTDPAAHPLVHRIDTHAASVFLEADRALKIKRAVHFPYLDYSTLAKRKAACDEEIKINRQFAPQIYRRVVPITQGSDGSLSIDGDGTPVEFAIEMTRFDERQTIDHLAEAGELDRDLVEAIADAIAASHAVAPLAPVEPWIQSIPTFIEGNTRAFRTAGCFPQACINDLNAASQSAFLGVRELLGQRGRQGYVRRCHGDLHLANIVLIERKPVLFDAIEFDPAIASVVDAVFAQESERAAIHDAARRLNTRFVGLFLRTDLATRLNRVGRREGDASDATPEIAGFQEEYDIGKVDWAVIDASGTPELTLRRSQIQIAHCEAAT
jgi:uncharacterized protein